MSDSIDRKAASELLRSPDTMTVPLIVILLSAYGDAIFTEDPLVIYSNVIDDFRAQMPEELENRFNAAITAMTTDTFFNTPEIFAAITGAINDGDIGDIVEGTFDASQAREASGFDTVTGAEMLWAINEVGILRGEDDIAEQLSPAVRKYVEDTIANEAEDSSDIDPETDTIEEAETDTYYMRFIREQNAELSKQLRSLGIARAHIKEITGV